MSLVYCLIVLFPKPFDTVFAVKELLPLRDKRDAMSADGDEDCGPDYNHLR